MMQNNIVIKAPSSSTIRLLQLAIAVLGIWLLLHSWVVTQQQGKTLLQQQTSQLMRETLKTLSYTAAYLIENDQLSGLEQLTRHLAESPYLHDAVVYDANGVRMSGSQNSDSASVLYKPGQDEQLQPMVQEIISEQQLLGYIKISLRLDASLSTVNQSWQQIMHHVLVMLLLAGMVTFFLKRSLSHFSRKKTLA